VTSAKRLWGKSDETNPQHSCGCASDKHEHTGRRPRSCPAKPAPATVTGWNGMIDVLRDLPAQMLAKLPEAQRKDPLIQQEIGRLALEAIASSALQVIGDDGDHPAFLPSPSQVLNIGQPNAGTTYRMAALTAGATYRLRGSRAPSAWRESSNDSYWRTSNRSQSEFDGLGRSARAAVQKLEILLIIQGRSVLDGRATHLRSCGVLGSESSCKYANENKPPMANGRLRP